MFSRARFPYQEIKNNAELEDFLRKGNRLGHPGEGCPEELYEVMKTCWADEPADRPTFVQLQSTLNQVIDDLINGNVVDYYSNVYLTVSQS